MKKPKESPLWAPMFTLPNVHTTFAIEVDGFAMVPPDDFRIKAPKQRRFGSFMKRFKTEFGDPVQPSVIIWRRDKPDTYRSISAISGFRDLVSMSVIPLAWARSHQWSRAMGVMYSDAFAVYPWMVDKIGDGLITRTPTMFGVHEVKRLRSQSMAALSPHTLKRRDVDLLLMTELLKQWERCFATDTPLVEDERLFRSLNILLIVGMGVVLTIRAVSELAALPAG